MSKQKKTQETQAKEQPQEQQPSLTQEQLDQILLPFADWIYGSTVVAKAVIAKYHRQTKG